MYSKYWIEFCKKLELLRWESEFEASKDLGSRVCSWTSAASATIGCSGGSDKSDLASCKEDRQNVCSGCEEHAGFVCQEQKFVLIGPLRLVNNNA